MNKKIETPLLNIYVETPYAKSMPLINGPYTRIYLIRHCHPDYRTREVVGDANMPLSELGKKQRKLLDKKLEQIQLDKLYSSEFKRAHETAERFAKKNKKKIFVDKRLNEIDWIDWYKIKYFNMSERTRVKRVTKYKEMDKRLHKIHGNARRVIADIYKKNKGKRVGVFCHGNMIRSMITGILNTDVIGFLSMEVYQSSVTKLVIDRDGFIKINYINNIAHLPHKPDEDIFLAAINQ